MTPIGKLQGHDASVTAIAVSESLKTVGGVCVRKGGFWTDAAASKNNEFYLTSHLIS